ncbi:MAG: chitobiase/beta-hexosaminidase C-terminal domain-containing protein, partial [Oscillospiraceae bacterium]
PVNGTEYISYNVNESNEAYSLPIIRYKLGAGATDIDKSGTLCQYGQRRVLSKTVSGITTVTVTYINPLPIVLTGEADKVITVNTVALSELEAYSNSAVASFEYTIFKAAAKPTAIPATSDTAFTMLAPGSFINLATSTANTSIYYTTNNSVPSPQDYLDWVKNGSDAAKKPATMLYDDVAGIVMPNKANTLFTIRAVAHSNDNSLVNSEMVQFTYQMPSPVNTVYVSPSQGSVLQGTAVQLKCGTADAHIFYKLHTTAPDLTDPAVVPKPFVDQLFDATVPIVINKEVWITAIAEKNGVTSTMTSYHYTLYSKTAQPTAIPATTPEAIATIKPNDVINLSTSTANASIYYTIDNSHPSPQEYLAWVQAGSDASKKPSTMLYKTLEGITMPNITTFFTIRAVAQSTEHGSEDSSEAQFTYQPPTAVQAVFVSPTAGAVVANQSVTLKCSTPGAKIFYRILTQKPANITDPENIPKPYKDQIFDATVPIVITKNIWIVALAEKDGMVSAPMLYEYTVSPLTTEPTASLKTGSVVNRGTRIRLSGLGNIAFTLDGSDPKVAVAAMQSASGGAKAAEAPPKAAEVFFGDSFIVDADFGKSLTVRAFSYGDGKTPSNVVSFTYTVCEKDGYITALPQSGSVITSGDQITLSTTISDGKLFYSTGTDTPSILNRYADAAIDKAENEPYTHYQWIAGENTSQGTSVKIKGTSGSTVTVKALAAANGSEGGATQVFTYTIREKTASPTASIPTGAVTLEGATVTLSAREGDIFFTTDGTTPSTSSRLYTEPIEVPGSMVLKAIALAKDKTESDVVEYHYSYADQAFAPSMSIPSGEIEQGKLLTLSSETKDASIYYTTNGAEPTEKSTLYTAPISIMRPVTIKAIAVYKGLRNSAVNSAFYTVIEPPAPEIGDGGTDKPQGPLNSLVSRRTYFDETAGPKFSAFVARDTATNTVLSAKDGIVPKDAKLIVKRVDTSDSDREAVRTALGNEIVVLYDVSLEKDGEKVDPTGEVELGITIPEEYQNSLVTVCRIGADNTVEEYEPRRSGQDAYFIVNGKLDRYAVTIPEELAVSGGKITINTIGKIAVLVLICLLLAGALAVFIIRKRSKKIESNLPVENDENFEEFFAQELHEDTRDTQQDILPQDEHNDTNG